MIKFAETEEEIKNCFPIIFQLRPHLSEENFVETVRKQNAEGYKLVFLQKNGKVKSVAGFRIFQMLSRGKCLYVDDLVTDEKERSKGFGDELFDWLVSFAKENNCESFNLDSGVQRFFAHRFYLRKRMEIVAHHFALKLVFH
ncbi:GNAT family N-acetyltransferase [bacterium]|nr:GNAT family N-acetyltransferase [bacterium]